MILYGRWEFPFFITNQVTFNSSRNSMNHSHITWSDARKMLRSRNCVINTFFLFSNLYLKKITEVKSNKRRKQKKRQNEFKRSEVVNFTYSFAMTSYRDRCDPCSKVWTCAEWAWCHKLTRIAEELCLGFDARIMF